MQATITIVITLPALHDALGKGFDHGLQRGMETVAMYKTARTSARPPQIERLLRCFPLSLARGATPVSAAICQRFLRPGNGRIVVTTLVWEPDPGLVGRLYERLHERTPTLLDCRPIPLVAALPEAGFVERTVIHFSFGGLLVDTVGAAVA